MSHPSRLAGWVWLFVALWSSAALAQDTQPNTPAPTKAQQEDVEAARQHFTRGRRLFDLQHYLDAAREYEQAYELRDDPALLFNIGQAYRLGGEYAKAVGAYKAYLRRAPKAKNRVDVEARINDLQQLIVAQSHTREAPPTGPENLSGDMTTPPVEEAKPAATAKPEETATVAVPPPQRSQVDRNAGREKRLWGLGLMAGGVAVLVTGAALVGVAYSTQHLYNNPPAGTRFDPSAQSRMRAEQAAGGVLLGVGIGAAATGAVLFALGYREQHERRIALVPIVGGGQAGAAMMGAF
jgi:tetratricopeptide (TPR) repeat protein